MKISGLRRFWTRRWRHIRFFLVALVTVALVAVSGVPGLAGISSPPVQPSTAEAQSSLIEQGRGAFQLGQYTEAGRLWSLAVEDYQNHQDVWNQALSLSYLSSAYQKLGNWDSARDAVEDSLSLLNTLSLENANYYPLLAQNLNTQGSLYLAMGQPEQAYQVWQDAEAAYVQTQDELGVFGSKLNQAKALQTMGLFRQEQILLNELSTRTDSLPDSALKVRVLNSLGEVLGITGDFDASELVLLESATIARQIADVEGEQAALFSLGNTQKALNRYDDALETFDKVIEIAPTKISQIEAQLSQLSILLLQEKKPAAAQQILNIAPQLTELEPSRTTVYARVNLANHWQTLLNDKVFLDENLDYQALNSSEAVASLLSVAVQQAQTIHDQRAEAFALRQLGQLYELNQQWNYAEDMTRQALNLSASTNAGEILYQTQWQLGRIYHKQSQQEPSKQSLLNEQAINSYQSSLQTLQTIRADLLATSAEYQFSFREKVEPIYRELVDLVVTPQAGEEELQIARGAIEDLQLAELQNFFRSACLATEAKQIDDIDPEAAVIYPIILQDRIEIIVSIAGQPLSHYTTEVSSSQVETVIDQLLEALNPAFSDESRLQLSEEVYNWLIRPIVPRLAENDVQTLAFVLDGSLKRLPMAALYDGSQYLVENFNLALAPSLELLDPRPLSSSELKILIGALTDARQGFPALPGVALEVSEIASKLPTETFLNEDFTREQLLNQVSTLEFPILHLATHGQFSSDVNSTFLLSWDDQISIRDFELLLKSRLPKVDHPIELLVLSACETAEGDKFAALGLAGLSLKSGTRSTLATLWAVNDASTALFMQKFYTYLLDNADSKAEALRQAQLEILNHPEFEHPYYWAPFILVGNWL